MRPHAAPPTKPRAVKRQCSENVPEPYSFAGRPCTKNATVERDGSSYCPWHDPVRIAEKQAEHNLLFRTKEVAYREQVRQNSTRQEARDRLADHAAPLASALEALLVALSLDEAAIHQGMVDVEVWVPEPVIAQARDALAKARGEQG